jgi:fumarylacetoacetate (FAA) hydrolase family protein
MNRSDGIFKQIINQLHAKWTNPESEIVKHMNSFAGMSGKNAGIQKTIRSFDNRNRRGIVQIIS